MKKDESKKRLKAAAKAVSIKLKSNFSGGNLNFCDTLQIEDSGYEGWFVAITSRTHTNPRFELYLDFYTGHHEPQFWYGFASNKRAEIENLAKISGLEISERIISDEDLVEIEGTWSLNKSLSNDINLPIREFYPKRQYYFGVYIQDSDRELSIISEEIINFFSCVADPNVQIISGINSELEGFKERVTKDILKRANAIVQEFLFHMTAGGKLRCDICKFDPEKTIKGTTVNPRSLLDVHHKIPLSEGERYTRIEDLQLLCPTCHRFEHAKMRIK